jgi:predicted DNA-binding protein
LKIYYREAMELIAIRVPEEMKAELEKMAEEQHRPLSNLVRLILMKWLETQHAEQNKKSK